MPTHILATTALATLLATALHAQTATGTASDAAEGEAPPLLQDEGEAGTGVEGGASAIVGGATNAQEVTVMPDPATSAQDGVAPPMEGAAPGEQAVGGATGAAAANDGSEADGGAADAAEAETTAPAVTGEAETGATENVETTTVPVETEEAQTGAAQEAETAAPLVTEGAETGAAEGALAEEGWSPVDLGAVSTERLVGQEIVTNDVETIATIEDVLIGASGEVESVVARFGGFLGFGSNRVELQMDEIEIMGNEGDELMVRTSLTPESIETRPEYEEEAE